MTLRILLLLLCATFACSCAKSSESAVQAVDVRVCTYLTGTTQGVVYAAPQDNPAECIVIRTTGDEAEDAALISTPCAELGYRRDGARTLDTGTPVPGVVATVEGGFVPPEVIDYDFRVMLAGPTGVRLVNIVGTSPERAWGATGPCYQPLSAADP